MIETLHCAHNGHPFTRERKRGVKPKYCEKHQPAKVVPISSAPSAPVKVVNGQKMQQLTCDHDGHSWERPSVRGKKPRFCPAHAPKPQEGSDTPTVIIPKFTRSEVEQKILDGPDSDLRRKVAYIVREYEVPRTTRDKIDWDGLSDARDTVLREAARSLSVPQPPVELMEMMEAA